MAKKKRTAAVTLQYQWAATEVRYSMYQTPQPPSETLPTMYDLPSENPEEPGLPDEFHDFQPKLLRETCLPPTYPQNEVFIGADLNLYYDARHPQWYKRPDWFCRWESRRAIGLRICAGAM